MKRYCNLIFAILILSVTLFSCQKDDFSYPEGYVGSSKITNYPILTLKGSDYMVIPKGGTYTESGVVAIEGSTEISTTTSGSVNTSTTGVYTLTYTAVNKDGYSASITRRVIVYSTDASAAAHDLSGSYARNTNGSVAEWTKLGPGVYKVYNPGGAPGTNLTVVVFNPTGYQIFIPQQLGSDGSSTKSASEDYSAMPNTYKWQIINPGYGTAVRTFNKQ